MHRQEPLQGYLEGTHIEMARLSLLPPLSFLFFSCPGQLTATGTSLLGCSLLLLSTGIGSLCEILFPVEMVALSINVSLWKAEDLQCLDQEIKWLLDVVDNVIIINSHLNEVVIGISNGEVTEPLGEVVCDDALFGLLLVLLLVLHQVFNLLHDVHLLSKEVLLQLHSLGDE